MPGRLKTIGRAEVRKDAREKVTGAARYTVDIPMANECRGILVRSPHHFARILSIDTRRAQRTPGVHRILTANEIPGNKVFGYLGILDQPVLGSEVVRHLGEAVALVIAEDLATAHAARDLVDVTYEVLTPIFDPEQAAAPSAPKIHGDSNVLTAFDIDYGDIAAGFDQAEVILDECLSTPLVAPAYLETENSLACWNEDDSLTVWVGSQQPFLDRALIASVLGLPEEKIQVKCAMIGGAFGGKEDSSLAILAALGAWSIRGNVRLVNSREESFWAHPKRHPAKFHYRIGAKKDGTLTAIEAQAFLDTGAYASYGPAVGSLATEMMAGSYRVPNVRLNTKVVYTNSPICGAMRGFGSPQVHFAIESLMDMLAAKLGLDPLELRRKNMLRTGDELFTKVVIDRTAESLPRLLWHADEARRRLRGIVPASGMKCGIGMALGMQSMGLGARVPDDSTHRLVWEPNGRVRLYLGAPDLGQGLAAVGEQIAAEALEIPFGSIETADLDTSVSPNGNAICASRMTYLAGNAILLAAAQVKAKLIEEAAIFLDQPVEKLSYAGGFINLQNGTRIPAIEIVSRAAEQGMSISSEATASFPYPEQKTPQHLPIGMPHVMFCFGCQVARVEVDPQTGIVRVTDLVAIHDAGKVINRLGVSGQIEGGVGMGFGFALSEKMALKTDGSWVDRFSEYLLPTSVDVPADLEIVVLEIPEASGPYGAKGLGEVTVVPTAPAIANAIFDATGVRVTHLPILPMDLV
jgi:CO/xanthine dehydrogenase Mo-binding subunit